MALLALLLDLDVLLAKRIYELNEFFRTDNKHCVFFRLRNFRGLSDTEAQ